MDARLRERRRILRVSVSRHINRNVRRRSHRADAFFVPWVRIRSLASRPTCIPRGGELASTSRAPCRCGSLRLLRPVPPRQRSPAACRGRHSPQRAAGNRAPYGRFRSRSVSKTATHHLTSAKEKIFRASFTFLRRLSSSFFESHRNRYPEPQITKQPDY